MATSIQRLRAKASAAGTLKTGKEQTVTTQTQGSETIIAIQPTDPQVVYVPTYDPNTAYGEWSNPSYPPTYYPTGGALISGLAWGVGIAAAGAMFGGWNWGYGGSGSYVNVNANRGDEHRPQLQSCQRRHRRPLAARREPSQGRRLP